MVVMMDFPVLIHSRHLVWPRLEAYYPVVTGLPNLEAQRKVNHDIVTTLNQMFIDQGYYENPQTQITGTYEIKTNERGILSLALTVYSFAGGAHGLTVMKALTWDVATGKLYQLNELFKPGSNYIKVISDEIKLQIKQRNIPLLVEFESIKPNQDFYIGDKSLVIFFQLYELAAYVFGILQFPISVYDLEAITKPDSPLEKMLY